MRAFNCVCVCVCACLLVCLFWVFATQITLNKATFYALQYINNKKNCKTNIICVHIFFYDNFSTRLRNFCVAFHCQRVSERARLLSLFLSLSLWGALSCRFAASAAFHNPIAVTRFVVVFVRRCRCRCRLRVSLFIFCFVSISFRTRALLNVVAPPGPCSPFNFTKFFY